MSAQIHLPFAAEWSATILDRPPMIAPARQFTWPRPVPGEEDTLARGAMFLDVRPAHSAGFLATCALGFASPSVPSGVWSCPSPHHLLAVSGGYSYLVDVNAPAAPDHIDPRPTVAILPLPEHGLIVLAGFHHAVALDAGGIRWTTRRLSWEGVTFDTVRDGTLDGIGWNMPRDRDVPFRIDLRTGEHEGGGFDQP